MHATDYSYEHVNIFSQEKCLRMEGMYFTPLIPHVTYAVKWYPF
jgi:hypothetical protein